MVLGEIVALASVPGESVAVRVEHPRSVAAMALFPAPEGGNVPFQLLEVPELTYDRSSRPFRCFKRACLVKTCINIDLGGGAIVQRKCGCEARAPKCKFFWSEQPYMWFRYEPTQVGAD